MPSTACCNFYCGDIIENAANVSGNGERDGSVQKQFLMVNVQKSFFTVHRGGSTQITTPIHATELGNYWGLAKTTVPSAAANKTLIL